MKVIAETERLILREFILDDSENFRRLNQDERVLIYTGDTPFKDEAEAKDVLVNKIILGQYEKYGYGRWAVHLQSNGIFIGWCGLRFLEEQQTVDLGFRLMKRFWKKGYATEAAMASLQYGFEELQLKEIIGRVDPKNTDSIHVLEKLGMKFYKTGDCHGTTAKYYKINKKDFSTTVQKTNK